jgi:hypothetical protein
MHAYERTFPVNNNTVDKTGVSTDGRTYTNPTNPVHLVIGTAGAVIDEKFSKPQPAWSAVRVGTLLDMSYGYTTMETSKTKLSFEFRKTFSPDEAFDYFEIVKS